MLTADSQKVEVFFSTKMQAEDVLNCCKMEVGGGECSQMAIQKIFLNALKEANAYSVSNDYQLGTLPLNNQEGCQFNSNLRKMLIRTQTIPIRELEIHLHSRMKLPMPSTARLVRFALVSGNPATERLSHVTGLFASLCCQIPRGVFTMHCKRKGLNKQN